MARLAFLSSHHYLDAHQDRRMPAECPCGDACTLPVDVVLRSKGSTLIGAHSSMLAKCAEAFPTLDMVELSDEPVPCTDDEKTLKLFLKLMHGGPQPSAVEALKVLTSGELVDLAYTAQKYLARSIAEGCSLEIRARVASRSMGPWAAMLYAMQYNDSATMDAAAPQTLAPHSSSYGVDRLDHLTARAWYKYREQYADFVSAVFNEPPVHINWAVHATRPGRRVPLIDRYVHFDWLLVKRLPSVPSPNPTYILPPTTISDRRHSGMPKLNPKEELARLKQQNKGLKAHNSELKKRNEALNVEISRLKRDVEERNIVIGGLKRGQHQPSGLQENPPQFLSGSTLGKRKQDSIYDPRLPKRLSSSAVGTPPQVLSAAPSVSSTVRPTANPSQGQPEASFGNDLITLPAQIIESYLRDAPRFQILPRPLKNSKISRHEIRRAYGIAQRSWMEKGDKIPD
ncbi:hypothetical protein NMY22_g8825 [Coprinellus aureogranulatus]|nr:hypothetical protein NMY22_g8825 [Coprinellus aureogranulatus]